MHRLSRSSLIPWLACAALVVAPALAPAQDHAHGHDHDHAATAAPVSPVPTPAQRWATDAPLRSGMAEVRTSVEALGHAEHGHLDAQQVSALAKAIEASINQMFAQCELEPEADHALHGVLGQLLQGTAALKQGTLDPAAIASMRQALQDYPRLFDDPQWSALAPSDH